MSFLIPPPPVDTANVCMRLYTTANPSQTSAQKGDTHERISGLEESNNQPQPQPQPLATNSTSLPGIRCLQT